MRTSPLDAGSSPATMRRNVVLPQPDGPTMAMNSPASISISISRNASSDPKYLFSPATASFAVIALILGPRHQPRFEPAEPRCHDDTGDGENDDAGEQLRHVEAVGRLADQAAEPGARAE